MEPRPDTGVSWMPRKLAGFLLLVVLYTPGSAHLFPASESAKTAATAQPPGDCTNCVDESVGLSGNRWTMPLLKLGEKRYYLGIFFKANWYRAAQYCRYHGMHLASINSQEENDKLEKHIRDFGLGHEHFWTSGTDQAEEGVFFWMSTGRPVTFTNWNTGEPNNFRYENGEEEHCLELWNRDGKGLKWNDTPCSFETFFVCEVP
ncbi:C-type lectin 37Db-like isoform X3 [Zootermopsis nevadensis]|uniref:C-type lectin 37Db-like isoform X3 n=1 Tax=Zootermopsis nevadensis TaxID=136037 RepID=UPI000B8E4A61|nr:C-type lectin 37Db-like isoform X3 [Zootermopsis nevadensis]